GPVSAQLRREPAGNLLLVAQDGEAYPCLTVLVTTLATAGVQVWVCDYAAPEQVWVPMLDRLPAGPVSATRGRATATVLRDVAALIRERIEQSEYDAAPCALVLAAVQRAREFDGVGGGEETELLDAVLRDGPEVGVHTIAWFDRPMSLDRR